MIYPIILKKKISARKWILINSFNTFFENTNELEDIIFKPKTPIEQRIFRQSLYLINNFQPNQFSYEAIVSYKSILDKIIRDKGNDEKIIARAKFVLRKINELDSYFIGDCFYPQIVLKGKQLRLFYFPIYTFNIKWVRNLIRLNFIKNYNNIYYIDINGLSTRAINYMMYLKTKDKRYYDIALVNEDIYLFLQSKYKILKNMSRKQFKNILISFWFGKQNSVLENIKYFANIRNQINSDSLQWYSTFFANNILSHIKKNNKNSWFLYVNLDGGVLVCKKPIEIKKHKMITVKDIEQI